MKPRILVTGGTGFLGTEVLPLLKNHFDVDLMSRQKHASVRGNLIHWDGGVNPTKLKGRYQAMLHMAGLYDFRARHEELMRTNVHGTHTALTIANKAEIPFFVNISTVAVAINLQKHLVLPEDAEPFSAYPDTYARSKALAESQVRLWSQVPQRRLNLRLGVLVANQNGDPVLRKDGPYHFIPTAEKLLPLLQRWSGPLWLPRIFDRRLPILPVNVAAQAIVDLTIRYLNVEDMGYKSLHIAPAQGPSGRDLLESLFQYLNCNKDVRTSSTIPGLAVRWLGQKIFDLPAAELVYLTQTPRLDTTETKALLGDNWCPEFSEYAQAMWKGGEQYVSNC